MSHRTTAKIIAALSINPSVTRAELARAANLPTKDSRNYLVTCDRALQALHKAQIAYIAGWQWRPRKHTFEAGWIPCWALQPRPGWYSDAQKPEAKP